MNIFILLAAAAITAPVVAQTGATAPSQTAETTLKLATVEADSEKLICKKQLVIGSLIAKKRVCATARNWERNEALAKEHLDILTAPGHRAGLN